MQPCIKYPITLQEHHPQVMQIGAPRTFGISNRSYFGHISPIVPHTFERIEDIGRVISVLLCPNLPGGRAPHWAEQGHYFTAVTVSPPSIFFSICSIFLLQFRALQFSSLFSQVYVLHCTRPLFHSCDCFSSFHFFSICCMEEALETSISWFRMSTTI